MYSYVRSLATKVLIAIALAAVVHRPLSAEGTPAPPDWQDGQGVSAYLPAAPSVAETVPPLSPPAMSIGPTTQPIVSTQPIAPANNVTPAAMVTPAAVAESKTEPNRHLAPPTLRVAGDAARDERPSSAARKMLEFGVPTQSLYTIGTALTIVVGAFLVFAWAMRRTAKKFGRGVLVPNDAVNVLGRVPLAAKQFAELLRVGNKLVLVALTPTGPKTITEVTDPVEVDRLVGLCQQFTHHSSTKAFEHVFQQFVSEPAADGFLGNDPLPTSLSSAATAYRTQRGTGRV